jgi:hypothetical protein
MKTFRKLGLRIDFHFKVRRVSRQTFSIPDWADDTHVTNRTTWDEDGVEIPWCIKYYKGSTPFFVDCQLVNLLSACL